MTHKYLWQQQVQNVQVLYVYLSNYLKKIIGIPILKEWKCNSKEAFQNKAQAISIPAYPNMPLDIFFPARFQIYPTELIWSAEASFSLELFSLTLQSSNMV